MPKHVYMEFLSLRRQRWPCSDFLRISFNWFGFSAYLIFTWFFIKDDYSQIIKRQHFVSIQTFVVLWNVFLYAVAVRLGTIMYKFILPSWSCLVWLSNTKSNPKTIFVTIAYKRLRASSAYARLSVWLDNTVPTIFHLLSFYKIESSHQLNKKIWREWETQNL